MNTDFRWSISGAVKELRLKRCFSQAEFARFLNITQAGLSHIESGKSSLSAEQLIFLIEKFNLSLDDFVKRKKVLPEQELQNAMVRLGAKHLREIPGVVISEKYLDVCEVVFQVLLQAPHSRLVAHLAPVVLDKAPEINFISLFHRLVPTEKQNRVWWLVEQVLNSANRRLAKDHLPKPQMKKYKTATLILYDNICIGDAMKELRDRQDIYDILDGEVVSVGHTNKARDRSDEVAKKWRLITGLTENDFYEALVETDGYAP